MHNKVVHRLARGLRRSGAVVLRFNFRGVGRSEGSYAYGKGEMDDAHAALEWLRARYPGMPYALAGFSFGARVILGLGCGLESANRLIAAGLPTRGDDLEYLSNCSVPKTLIQSTHDEFGPRSKLEAAFAGFAPPKQLFWVEAADHFFRGGLDRFEQVVAAL
jgi:hypothetical protein